MLKLLAPALHAPVAEATAPVTPLTMSRDGGAITISAAGAPLGTFANPADAWAAIDRLDDPLLGALAA